MPAEGTVDIQDPAQPAAPAAPAAPASPAPAPAPAEPRGSQDDARQRGMLADLQKERKARQELERRLAEQESRLTTEQKRVQALAGLTPRSAEDEEAEQVRQRVVQLFPALGKLTDEQVDRLMQIAERGDSMEQAVAHHWETHGRQMVDSLVKEVSDAVGGDLNERQIRSLSRAYVAEAESNPEFLQRHQRGDRTLIAEFAKQWMDDWFEPARRRATADAVNGNRRVPSGRDRTVQTTPPKAVNFKDAKSVEDAMVESFRSHGGRFEN